MSQPTDHIPRGARRLGRKIRRQISRLNRVGFAYASEEERAAKEARYWRLYAPFNNPAAPRPDRQQLLADMRDMVAERLTVPRSVHLFIRDEGLCTLCLAPVDFYSWAVKGWRPDRFSFDHIIPKAQGGSNIHRNIRLTHGICNRVRDQWMDGEPLPPGRKGTQLRLLLELADRNRALPPDERETGPVAFQDQEAMWRRKRTAS
jgi:hypothetical protein